MMQKYRIRWQVGYGPKIRSITVRGADEAEALSKAKAKGFPGGFYTIETRA